MSHNWLHTPDCKVLNENEIVAARDARLCGSRLAFVIVKQHQLALVCCQMCQ